MTIPRVALVAFEARNPQFIFVAIPDERGRHVKTERCVAMVACPVCHVETGEPCKGVSGYTGGIHYARRNVNKTPRSAHFDDLSYPPTPDILGAHMEGLSSSVQSPD